MEPAARRAYWRKNLGYLLALLSVWFFVSYGCGILLVDQLDRVRIGGFKLGFWFAQQGSIYTFVALIFVYVVLMNRLDRRFGVAEEEPRSPPGGDA
jgi:putative solute:sodium symporter small subunit